MREDNQQKHKKNYFFRYLNNPYHEPIMSTEEENQIIESTISAFAPMNEQTRRVEVAELSDDETGFIDGIEENAATPSICHDTLSE